MSDMRIAATSELLDIRDKPLRLARVKALAAIAMALIYIGDQLGKR